MSYEMALRTLDEYRVEIKMALSTKDGCVHAKSNQFVMWIVMLVLFSQNLQYKNWGNFYGVRGHLYTTAGIVIIRILSGYSVRGKISVFE